jgi:hypothetical protein
MTPSRSSKVDPFSGSELRFILAGAERLDPEPPRLGPTKTRRPRLVSLLHPITDDIAEWRSGATAAC